MQEPWSMPSKQSLSAGGRFGQFSSVCWFFGKQVYEGLNKQVPIGLISDNWGGTPVESWSTAASLNSCGEDNKPGSAPGSLYNAMIHPFTVGPMAVTGFTWYQGEANTRAGSAPRHQSSTTWLMGSCDMPLSEMVMPHVSHGHMRHGSSSC